MGTMRERKRGVWEIRVAIGQDPTTGKYKQVSRTVHGGKETAKKALARLETEHADGLHKPTAGTFDQLLDAWLETATAAGRSKNTIRGYRGLADRWLRPELGALPLAKVTTRRLDQVYANVAASGCGANTVSHVHAVARRALNQALRWGWITTNPALATTRPAVGKSDRVLPTVEELHAILEAAEAEDEDMAHLIRVAAALGGRRGELCGLRWSDIDIADEQAGMIHIRRSVIDVDGIEVKDTKTHAVREVEIGVDTVRALAEHWDAVRARAEDLRTNLVPDAYVFSREPDGSAPLRPDWVTKAFGRACIAAGLHHPERTASGKLRPTVRFQDLRHLNATLQLAAGVPVHTVAKRHGHRDTTTTINIYGHAIPGGGRDAANILGDLLGRRDDGAGGARELPA